MNSSGPESWDGKDTTFYLDPPYKGHDGCVGESQFDEARFFDLLRSLKGKWLLTYGTRGVLPKLLRKESFVIREFAPRRHFRNQATSEGARSQLLVANYDISRRALRELRAKRVGHWTWIRWGDALEWLDGKRDSGPSPTKREDRVADRVDETIRREDSLAPEETSVTP